MTSNVTHFPVYRQGAERASQLVGAGEDIPAVQRLQVFQTLNRHWRRYLTATELSLALYIVDRTVGWGKSAFAACGDNILFGNEEFAGLGISRASYFRAVKSLEAKGMIIRRGSRAKTHFQFNVDWRPEENCVPLDQGSE
jgi:hypothetical protein